MSQQRENQRGIVSQTTTTTVSPILKLRAQERQARDVSWDANVVDNEHLNKKKTKICCIFHPSDRNCDEEDSSSSSDSSSDSSDNEEDDKNRKIPRNLTITKSQNLMRTKFSPITKPIKGARKMKYLVSFTYTYIVIINNSYTFYIFKSPFSFTPFAKLLILAVLSS